MAFTVEVLGVDETMRATRNYANNVSDSALSYIAIEARNEWIRLAGERLNRSYEEYVRGLSEVIRVEPGHYEIHLTGFLPLSVELGLQSYDMKYGGSVSTMRGDIIFQIRGHLESPTARVGEGGVIYYYIPFQWRQSAGSGTSRRVLEPMPEAGMENENDIANFKKQFYREIRNIKRRNPTSRRTRERAVPFQASSSMVMGYNLVRGVEQFGSEFHERHKQPHHVSSLYERLTVYEKRTNTGRKRFEAYTFRTMSSKQSAEKWRRKQTEGKMIHEEVISYIDTVLVPRV